MGRTHGTEWTDALIKEKILEAKEALRLERMPSRKECSDYYHNDALASAVSRRKGWYTLAMELGLPIKNTETYFGKTYEAKVAEMLMARGFDVRRMATRFPYDLLVNDCIKIDVKASRLYRGPQGDFYTFSLGKEYATCDFYVLVTEDDTMSISGVYVVPSKFVIAQSQISMGVVHSKYQRFKDRWDLLENVFSYWESIS